MLSRMRLGCGLDCFQLFEFIFTTFLIYLFICMYAPVTTRNELRLPHSAVQSRGLNLMIEYRMYLGEFPFTRENG